MRPLTVGAGLRAPLPPGDGRGRTAGAHRGRDAPPGEPIGCMGSSRRRFLLFLSPHRRRRRRRLLGKRKKKKKRVLGRSCWKVSAKPPPSAAVPPKFSPSPDEAAAAARASCTNSQRMLRPLAARVGSEWVFLVPSPGVSPRRDASPLQDTVQKERRPVDFGKVRAVNPFKMVVSEEGRLGYNHRETGFYYMKIFVFEKGG